MGRSTALLVLLLGGCTFDRGGLPVSPADSVTEQLVDAAGPADMDLGEGADLSDLGSDGQTPLCAAWTPAPKHFDPCKIPLPTSALDLDQGDWVYDTTSGTLTAPDGKSANPTSQVLSQSSGPDIRVLSLQELKVRADATLRVEGDHPLVVASWSEITVEGTIDVSSNNTDGAGAGADPSDCSSHAAGDGKTSANNGGGGGGGGFGGDGGEGGEGQSGVAGGAGGSKVSAPQAVRGGCHGGEGGDDGGGGGEGGGALQLSAMVSITVGGVLHAGGAGGEGPLAGDNGGGGGGSGGYLGLDAPGLILGSAAILAANGGGGGEGSSSLAAGNDGDDALAEATAAPGGSGGSNGGEGTDGGWRDQPDAAKPGPNSNGGGGGGGGVGFVLYNSASPSNQGATTSPNMQAAP